ncbi:MAG: transaldolase family protein [Pseudonocardiaceae bacterium]
MAADAFRPTFDATAGTDGFVSFELEPALAHDAAGSVCAARTLVERIAKPNIMIKMPGTPEAPAAVEDLIAAGVNVNRSVRCGPRRGPRTRLTPTWSTSRSSSAPTPSTPCPRQR